MGLGCSSQPNPSLRIFAASSLIEVFKSGEVAFEMRNPEIDVQMQFAGSHILKSQIQSGAPADVFASANRAHIQELFEADTVNSPVVFAANRMALIVPNNNPKGVAELADLEGIERLILADQAAPAGSYARQVLERAKNDLGADWHGKVISRIVSNEPNVRLVTTKVGLGEADAGLVYVTDALASDRVTVVSMPDAYNVQTEAVMGVVSAGNSERALHWISFWRSSSGQDILKAHGFIGESK